MHRDRDSFIHSFIFILFLITNTISKFYILIKGSRESRKVDAGKRQTLKHARRKHGKSKRKRLRSMPASPKEQEKIKKIQVVTLRLRFYSSA